MASVGSAPVRAHEFRTHASGGVSARLSASRPLVRRRARAMFRIVEFMWLSVLGRACSAILGQIIHPPRSLGRGLGATPSCDLNIWWRRGELNSLPKLKAIDVYKVVLRIETAQARVPVEPLFSCTARWFFNAQLRPKSGQWARCFAAALGSEKLTFVVSCRLQDLRWPRSHPPLAIEGRTSSVEPVRPQCALHYTAPRAKD